MTHHVGFLYLSDSLGFPVEVVNEARTAALLAGHVGISPYLQDAAEASCPGLQYQPCTVDPEGTVTAWALIDDSLAGSPWVGTSEASMEALGFTIEEWTGIDGAHHGRSVAPVGGPRGGARFGPPADSHRVMSFNVILHGTSERGLTHLFRWLERTLFDACSPCSKTSLWLREFCPAGTTVGLLEEGLRRADDVVLLSGPTWIDPPLEDGSCYVRRATFTLAAGDPCLYAVPGTLTSTTLTAPGTNGTSTLPAGCAHWDAYSVTASASFEASDFGLVSPIITISAPLQLEGGGSRKVLPTLRIVGFLDPRGEGLRPCEQRRVGLIIIEDLPSGYEFVIDTSDAHCRVRDLHGDREWVDGSQFLRQARDFDSTYVGRRSISFSCVGGGVVVEPAYPAAVPVASTPSTWSVDIQPVVRVGCS